MQHWTDLRAYALALTGHPDDAEDLMHDTAVLALRGASSFEPGTSFRAWVFTIQRNRFLNAFCRRPRLFRPLTEAEENRAIAPANQDARVALTEAAGAIRRLPPAQRRALLLVAGGGVKYEDAARLCGCSIGTVKSRVARARRALVRRQVDFAARPI